MIPQEDTEWGLGSRSEIGRKAICDLPRGALVSGTRSATVSTKYVASYGFMHSIVIDILRATWDYCYRYSMFY